MKRVFKLVNPNGSWSDWCRDGYFIEEHREKGMVYYDTYWGNHGNTTLYTWEEINTFGTIEFYFDLDEVEAASKWNYEQINPQDRYLIPEQKGCYKRYYKKLNAKPCQDTIIGLYEHELHCCESALESAQNNLKWAKERVQKALEERNKNENSKD